MGAGEQNNEIEARTLSVISEIKLSFLCNSFFNEKKADEIKEKPSATATLFKVGLMLHFDVLYQFFLRVHYYSSTDLLELNGTVRKSS